MQNMKEPRMDFAEVFDSINEARKFIKLNKIKKCKVTIIWNDFESVSWERDM